MKITTIPLGKLQTNAYFVIKEGRAAIIDPGGDCDVCLAQLQSEGAVLEGIYLTHGHADHVAAAMELKRATGARIYGHPGDLYLLSAVNDEVAAYLGLRESITLDEALIPESSIELAGTTFLVLGTPGHTPGSICLYSESEQVLFSGDTLFAGSIGRSDLSGGNSQVLRQTLRHLKELPAETAVYPGHGPSTTIAAERMQNRYW